MPELPLNYTHLDGWLRPNVDAARWCVAFSGGPDSTALLHLMHRWCVAYPGDTPALIAVHINHGMQDHADAWQAHCEVVCAGWGIPLITHQALVESSGQGAEAAARQARYALFESELKADDILFMGHHLDDQVETYFLRLMRGSGLSGLSAMPAQRPLGDGQLIRPLIAVERAALERYLEQHDLSAIQDPSNLDTSIDRNYLRQAVLPMLEARWKGYRHTVARAAEHSAASQAIVAECLPAPSTVFSVLGDPGIEQKQLDAVSPEAAMIKLRHWLQSGGYSMPDQGLLVEFMRQLREGAAGSSPRLECSSYVLQRYQNCVYLLPEFSTGHDAPAQRQCVTIKPGESCNIAGVGTLSLVPAAGQGLRLLETDSLELRWRQGGERCRPQGRPYSQRLKKLFQESAVPPWWRERVALLYLQDELLAVGGLWLCESSRLDSQTDEKAGLWQPCWQRKPCSFH